MRRVLQVIGRVLAIVGSALGVLIVLAAIAILVISRTDFGRERVRRLAVREVNKLIAGQAHIGKISGNLLTGATLSDVTITDSAGQPFISVDTVKARYGLRPFLSQQIILTSLTLVDPVVVLDKPPDGTWNWDRILFPPKPPHPPTLGWGSWLKLHDVTLVHGTVIARSPWHPPEKLAGAARDSAIHAALSGETRLRVAPALGGYQKVMRFDSLDAHFPYIRLADPDSTIKVVQADRLSTAAEPFRPPVMRVTDLVGTFRIDKDSLWWHDGRVTFPDSKATITGVYMLVSGDYRLAGHADPIALADLRWIDPRLPSHGSGATNFTVVTHGDTNSVYAASGAHFTIDSSTIAGDVRVSMDDTTRFSDTRLRFADIDSRLIEQLAPSLRLPRGTFTGRTALDGSVGDLRLDADVAFDGARTGTSHVVAVGALGFGGGTFHANDLHLTFEPVQMALVREQRPTLPLAGTLRGTAVLDGSLKNGLAVQTSLALDDRGAISRVTGGGEVALDGRTRRVNLAFQVQPLSLATAGRFSPSMGLHGTARGTIRAQGTLANVNLLADLQLPAGGRLLTSGTLDLASAVPRYDVTAELRDVKPRAVMSLGPPATLTAVATARGRGITPATMTAAVAVNVSNSAVDSVPFDSAVVRLAIANGIVTVDSALARTPFAHAWAHGTFGLAAGHAGTLAYRMQVDSLGGLQQFLPPPSDTSAVAPRSARVAEALAKARADSARIAKATEVERAATGAPPPRLEVAPVPALSPAALAGALYTAGAVRGSLASFEVHGRLALSNVLARGAFVSAGTVEYAVVNGRTPAMAIAAAGTFDSVQVSGFALDSVTTRVAYQQPKGYVDVAVYQDSARDYRAVADFALHTGQQSEVHFSRMAFRFDTTQWVAAHPSAITWGPSGIAVDSLELASRAGGHIFVDGQLHREGTSNLALEVHGLQVADIAALLQSSVPTDGVLQLSARVTGTERAPVLRGALALGNVYFGGVPVPDVRTTFEYADATMLADAQLMSRDGRRLAIANARIPVNLALTGSTTPRFPDEPLAVDVRAENLPLAGLSHVMPQVSDVRGTTVAAISVRGTAAHPTIAGALGLDDGAVRLVPLGITLTNLEATLHMQGDTVVIDSLVGNTVGRVRLAGTIELSQMKRPRFALALSARGATVLDNEDGRITVDGSIAIHGPFDSAAVTGNTRILSGIYYLPTFASSQPISLMDSTVLFVVDTSAAEVRDILPKESPLLENLQVNVSLAVSRDTWIRTPDANVEIYSTDPLSIHLDRRRQRLTMEGVVNTDRGNYTFLGRRFVLSRGTITFIGGPASDALVQVTGERDIQLAGRGPQAINVVIGGTVSNLRITLSSNAQPPIPEEELLSYLAFGRSPSSLLQVEGSTTFSGQESGTGRIVGQVAAVATRQLAAIALGTLTDEFEESAARTLGADVFNITPADIPAEVSLNGVAGVLRGTAVEAGKYVGPRTFIGITAQPTVAPPGASLQYLFPGGFQLQTSIEPRYLLREPTLTTFQTPLVTSVFGTFLLGDWRF
ncbi:MAG TPA: translocation/assembly module TamB domain-containing protein [Gemmatimonadaceae bacterium]